MWLQTVWLQDIPLRSSPIPRDPKATDDFASVFQRVLYSVNVQPALKTMLNDNVRKFITHNNALRRDLYLPFSILTYH
jgi:hypothetical protein